jgi:ribosomal protein L7/L12
MDVRREKAPIYLIPEPPVEPVMWLSFEYTSAHGATPDDTFRSGMRNGVVVPYDLVIKAAETYGFKAEPGRKYKVTARLLVDVDKKEVYAIHDTVVEPFWTDGQLAAMKVVKELIEEDRFGEWLMDARLMDTVWEMMQPVKVAEPCGRTAPTYLPTYEVIITAVANRVQTMKAIRKLNLWSLVTVKQSIHHLPLVVGYDLPLDKATEWAEALREVGCEVSTHENEIPIEVQGIEHLGGWYPRL